MEGANALAADGVMRRQRKEIEVSEECVLMRSCLQEWLLRIETSIMPWGAAQRWWHACRMMLGLLDGIVSKLRTKRLTCSGGTKSAEVAKREVDVTGFESRLLQACLGCLEACNILRDDFGIRSEVRQRCEGRAHLSRSLRDERLREPSEAVVVRGVVGSDVFCRLSADGVRTMSEDEADLMINDFARYYLAELEYRVARELRDCVPTEYHEYLLDFLPSHDGENELYSERRWPALFASKPSPLKVAKYIHSVKKSLSSLDALDFYPTSLLFTMTCPSRHLVPPLLMLEERIMSTSTCASEDAGTLSDFDEEKNPAVYVVEEEADLDTLWLEALNIIGAVIGSVDHNEDELVDDNWNELEEAICIVRLLRAEERARERDAAIDKTEETDDNDLASEDEELEARSQDEPIAFRARKPNAALQLALQPLIPASCARTRISTTDNANTHHKAHDLTSTDDRRAPAKFYSNGRTSPAEHTHTQIDIEEVVKKVARDTRQKEGEYRPPPVCGVNWHRAQRTWQVNYKSSSGEEAKRQFSVMKLGEEEALRQAIEFRKSTGGKLVKSGISFDKLKTAWKARYWVKGKVYQKSFPVARYGEEAKKLALAQSAEWVALYSDAKGA